VVAVPGGAGGFILGSVLIKKLSLTTQQQLRAMFYLALVCLASMTMFFVQCDTAPIVDPSTSRPRLTAAQTVTQ